MTGKEIKKIRTEIPRFSNGVACNLTAEQKQLHRELDCREMINSCLCYGSNFLESRYSEPYIQDLGRERLKYIMNKRLILIRQSFFIMFMKMARVLLIIQSSGKMK